MAPCGMLSKRAALLPLLLSLCACAGEPEAPREIGESLQGGVESLARSSEPTRGLDPALLDSAYSLAAGMPRLRSLLVARHGELLREQYFRGAGPGDPANIKSASKSVLSALIGIAIAEGHLEGVDQPIGTFFPDAIPEDADPRVRSITVGHLLSMQAGLRSTSFDNYGDWVASSDWIGYALRQPMVGEPGGSMIYSTGSSHLLSAILTRATGTSTYEYAREKLARPLGIELRPWTTDPRGIYFGGNEMRMRPRDMLRFGEMYRNGGRHEGIQVVPREWVEESWRPRTASPFNGHRYGYGWWSRRAGGRTVHFAWGYGGQFIFVVPDLEMTVVTTSEPNAPRGGAHLRQLHELVGRVLVPAAERGDPREGPGSDTSG